jgi:hypothetical protein
MKCSLDTPKDLNTMHEVGCRQDSAFADEKSGSSPGLLQQRQKSCTNNSRKSCPEHHTDWLSNSETCSMPSFQCNRSKSPRAVKAPDKQRSQQSAAKRELHDHRNLAPNHQVDGSEQSIPEHLRAKQELLAGSREPYLCLPEVSVGRGVHTSYICSDHKLQCVCEGRWGKKDGISAQCRCITSANLSTF